MLTTTQALVNEASQCFTCGDFYGVGYARYYADYFHVHSWCATYWNSTFLTPSSLISAIINCRKVSSRNRPAPNKQERNFLGSRHRAISWAELSVALKMAQQLNDTAAARVASSPKRIIGSFVFPLQDMNLAMAEFKRAVDDLGLKFANVPGEVRGNYLRDAQFRPFWGAAQEDEVAVFMHPDGAKDCRCSKFPAAERGW